MLRELDSRSDTFVTVTLLWEDETDETFIELDSGGSEEIFPVPASEATEAFLHPFVYQARRMRHPDFRAVTVG
jgi:hypothetical protein